MATVMNDRDVLLLGTAQRSTNPQGATILITADNPAFHVNSSNVTTPSYITFTAHLLGITGTASFTASGATITDNHDNTATIAYNGMSGASATVTATATVNGQTYSASTSVAKITDGTAGGTGPAGDQHAIAYLYQWNVTTPAKPTGTTVYTWANSTNSTYTDSDNWSVTVPSNPGTPGLSLYVAAMPISASGGTTTTSVSYTSSTVQAWTTNGAQGPQGNAGTAGMQSATINVYQWAASIPAGPSGTSTYTWNGGAIGTVPSGWSATPGTAASQGMTLWAARIYLTDSATNSQTSFNWTSAAVVAVGYSGNNGAAGTAGASYVTAYCASTTATTTTAPAQTTGKTSLPATNDGGIVGTWSSTVPSLTSGQYMYQTDGIYDPQTNKVTWSVPYWSSLKVGTLSAITTNTGNLNVSGTISSANGKFSVDANGNVIMQSASMQDGSGNVILQVGTPLADAYVPSIGASKLNVTLGGDNLINNSGFDNQTTETAYRPNGFTAYNNAGVSTSFVNVTGRLGGKAFGLKANQAGASTFGVKTGNSTVEVDGTVGGVAGGWQPNKTYVISFKAKKVNGAGFSTITLQWNTPPSNTVWVARPNLSTSWQTYTARITFGGVEPLGQLYIDCNNNGSGSSVAVNDEIHFDELIVQEGDVYSEWFPSARDAMTSIALIANDNILSKGEKPAFIQAWNVITAEESGIVAQAASLGVSSADYVSKYTTLQANVNGISPAYSDLTQDSPITGVDVRTNFSNYYTSKQALLNAIAAKAATLAAWTGVANRPQDTTNLVLKTNFEDGAQGNWDASATVVSVTGQTFTKALQVGSRDTYENGLGFPVNAGETLYAEAWLDASTANYTLNFGIYFVKADGSATTVSPWTSVVSRSAGAGWAFGSGSCTVPVGAVIAYPWLQIGGSTGLGTARATLMRISRYQSGATVGAPSGTLVGSVSADLIATATTNFNSSNDRNGAAVTAPTILTDGTAVDHTIRTDGSADISFEWVWSGNEGDIDGFLVYVYQSSSSAAYSFGTTPAAETVSTVPANKRAFILFGAAANLYTTFGIQAYRHVDKDINPTGAIKSLLVKPTASGENPYQPSSNVAFSGNITGTINGIAASNVNVWSSISGTGKPADNASADLLLVGRGVSVVGNTAIKLSGSNSWDSDCYSLDSFTGGAYASVVAADTTSLLMFGLNSDPTTNSSYNTIDYAIYLDASQNPVVTSIYENGAGVANFGTWAVGDVFAVIYDGSSVKYLKNGAVFYTSAGAASSAPNQRLYFDSSLCTVGATLKNIRFGPLSSNNWANIGGANKPQDNATVGATLGVNVNGTASSLYTLSPTIGTFSSAPSGGRVVISDGAIKVYDTSGAIRIKIGNLSL